ncbi:MAG: metallophosphoesterase family protein [bacterium]
MLYGVFADIHSNLEALNVVLEFFKQHKIQNYICSGDIVGYGPNPNECISKLKALKRLYCVAGNHDRAVVGMKSPNWFNEYAQRVLLWTKRQLNESSRAFLIRLPLLYEHTHFSIAHGSPRDPIDEYLLSPIQFLDNLKYFHTQVCFIGHTHFPICFLRDKLGRVKLRNFQDGEKIKINPELKLVYNLGSVGQPRDNNTRACCALYDTDTKEISFHRLEYDVEKTQAKMRQAALPLFLIDRLAYGR